MLFRKKKDMDKVEERFQTMVNLIKDLDKTEFKRLMGGMECAWQSYNQIRRVQTIDEKDNVDINRAEAIIEQEIENTNKTKTM